MKYAGSIHSQVNLLLLNWPDALLYMAEDNHERLRESLSLIICQPLRVLVEALTSYVEQKTNTTIPIEEVSITMIMAKKDPLGAKKNLIRICNNRIFTLKSFDEKIEEIKE